MKVRVQDTGAEHFVGFHDYARRRPGDVFEIPTRRAGFRRTARKNHREHREGES